MKTIITLTITLLLFAESHIAAQARFDGVLDYGDYKYEYRLIPIAKEKYDLKITTLDKINLPHLVYQSHVHTEGALTQGSQYKVFFFLAEKIENKWKIDPTSHVEVIFDLIDNTFKHRSRGMIAKFEAPQIAQVLDVDLAMVNLTESQAINYAMQFVMLNYNQLFGQYAITVLPELVTKQIGESHTVFIASNHAESSMRDTINVDNKNYVYTLTETEKDKYSLEIKFITRGADIVSEETVYSSTLKVSDWLINKNIYRIQIFYAKGEGYLWRTTPQSYFQSDFNFNKKVVRSQSAGKIKETQTVKFSKEVKFADKKEYTSKEMLNETVHFFVKNFNKALTR